MSTGAFVCSPLSSINIGDGASIEVFSATINLECSVIGSGNVSLSCDDGGAIALGGHSYDSSVPYHLSNSELALIQTTGTLAIGIHASNVSNMWIDGLSVSSAAASLLLTAIEGSITFLNTSSAITLNANSASLAITSKQNTTVGTSLTISFSGVSSPSLTMRTDSDCSVTDGDHFAVASTGSVTVPSPSSTAIILDTPRVSIEGLLNISSTSILKIQRACALVFSFLYRFNSMSLAL